jgi:hypothetical protein
MINLLAKFHMPNSKVSFVVAIKPEEYLDSIVIFLSYVLQKIIRRTFSTEYHYCRYHLRSSRVWLQGIEMYEFRKRRPVVRETHGQGPDITARLLQVSTQCLTLHFPPPALCEPGCTRVRTYLPPHSPPLSWKVRWIARAGRPVWTLNDKVVTLIRIAWGSSETSGLWQDFFNPDILLTCVM